MTGILRLWHIHPMKLHAMAKQQLAPGLPPTLLRTHPHITCTGCATGKQAAAPFRSLTRTAPIGIHIHTDVCGPLQPSLDHNKYFATFLDEGSRYLFTHCSRSKGMAAGRIAKIIKHITENTPYRLKHMTSDNAREHYTNSLPVLYDTHSISSHPTVLHIPQENALIERINRTLLNTAGASLYSSKLPIHLWGYEIQTATHVYNHTPRSSHGQLPVVLWSGETPDVSTLCHLGPPATSTTRHPEEAGSKSYHGPLPR